MIDTRWPRSGFRSWRTLIPETMGWETRPADLEPYLPVGARIVSFEHSGHFIHIEQPREVADLVLEFLGA